MIPDILESCESQMSKASDHVVNNFKKLRTGRITTDLFDPVKCDYYGSPTPINQISNLQIGDASTLVIKPFERKYLGDIEKAINKANLGVSLTNDGIVLRVQVPPLNEERRKGLVAEAKDFSEEGKVKARDARREANKALDALKKEGASEDEIKKGKEDVDGLLKKIEAKIDSLLKEKSDEILSI